MFFILPEIENVHDERVSEHYSLLVLSNVGHFLFTYSAVFAILERENHRANRVAFPFRKYWMYCTYSNVRAAYNVQYKIH